MANKVKFNPGDLVIDFETGDIVGPLWMTGAGDVKMRQPSRGKPVVKRTSSDEYYEDNYSYQIELNQFITTMSHKQMEEFAAEVCGMLGWVAMPAVFDGRNRGRSQELEDVRSDMAKLDTDLRDGMNDLVKSFRQEKNQMNQSFDEVKKGAEQALKEIEKMLASQKAQDELTGTAGGGRRLQIDG